MRDGYYISLGIGIPILVGNYIALRVDITLKSANDMIITDLVVFERADRRAPFALSEITPQVSADCIRDCTEAFYVIHRDRE